MNIAQEAYKEMFGKEHQDINIQYNRRFKPYNAKITKELNIIRVKAAKEWKGVSKDIQKGLIQELLVKLHNNKKHTISMDLYSNFIKNLAKYTTKTETHPVLEKSFERINTRFFKGLMERPNLKMGNSVAQLGKYEYATDTVTISTILLDREDLLDYVMHHELLHKKHQFSANAGRHRHHTKQFRKAEQAYPNAAILEKELDKLVRKNKRSFTTAGWFKIDRFINEKRRC